MRITVLARAAASFALLLALGACAKTMGQAAGTLVGGTTWVAMKAVNVTGRTAKGAANGVHEEFSKKDRAS